MSNAIPTEPITADPVIINNTESESIETRLSKLEEALAAQNIGPEGSSSQKRNPRTRERSFSPVVRRRYVSPEPFEQLPVLTNTTTLLALLAKEPEKPDMLVEIQSGPGRSYSHMTYLTTIPPHQVELDKVSWLLRLGLEECWSQKQEGSVRIEVHGGPRPIRGRVEYVDERYEERFDRVGSFNTILKLGRLFTALFPGNDGEVDEEKVKFITVVQGRGHYPPSRLVVSYTRRGALVDLFHELVNGYSISFVGAVLKDVDIAGSPKARVTDELNYKKVGSVEEAEKVDEGVVGVIC